MPISTYPGITGVVSLDGTLSIGISPAAMALVCFSNSTPNLTGDLTIGDGTNPTITFRNCKRDHQEQVTGYTTDHILVRLLDRRWTWKDGFVIDGHFNQLSAAKKLIPWRVRSPYQLARLLLAQMGEYSLTATLSLNVIDLPGGLAAQPVAGVVPTLNPGYSISVKTATWAGGTATIITAVDHGLRAGQTITISGVSPAGFNGTFVIAVAGLNTFTFALGVNPGLFVYGGQCDLDLTIGANGSTSLDRIIDPASDYLGLGQNLPTSRTNPLVLWESLPAALALANLCELYGRAVVWDVLTDKPRIIRLGNGPELPNSGVWVSNGSSVTGEAIPDQIVIRGAPTRYQWRLRFRHVNKEWDGSWVVPSRVSYAPTRAPQTMVVWIYGAYNAAWSYSVTINGVVFAVAGSGSFPAVVSALATAINTSGNPAIAGKLSASTGTTPQRLVITGATVGYEFELVTDGSTAPATAAGWLATCMIGPIEDGPAQQQAKTISFGVYAPGDLFTVTVAGNTFFNFGTETDLGSALQNLADSMNVLKLVTHVLAAAGGTLLTLTGDTAGVAFGVTASTSGAGPAVVSTVSGLTGPAKGWEKSWGSFGWAAQATANLSYPQAKRLAEESVYRCYQLVNVDPADETVHSIPTPGYPTVGATGTCTNRFRLMIQGSRPQPIAPAPGDANVIDPKTGQPYAAEQYNGFSVDRPNIAFGSVWHGVISSQGLIARNATYFTNTPKRSYLPVSFQLIDPEKGVIQFSRPVYRILGQSGGGTAGAAVGVAGFPIPGSNGCAALPSDIVIECGVEMLDDPSGIPARYSYALATGGFAPTLEKVFSDVQLEVIGQYNARHQVTGSVVLDDDAENRAAYYARAIADTLQLPDGVGRKYEGILSIPLDGKTRQVQWTIDSSGCFTQVGSNSEFSRVVVPYPARRRAENLTQDVTRAQQNISSDFRLRGAGDNAAIRSIVGSTLWGGAK